MASDLTQASVRTTATLEIPASDDVPDPSSVSQLNESDKSDLASVTFIRHAQALHNISPPSLHTRDSGLTPRGIDQCSVARMREAGRFLDEADLVIVSPLRRALQTATLLSGERRDTRFLVTPLVTERRALHVTQQTDIQHTPISSGPFKCNEGSPPQELLAEFPYIAERAVPDHQFLDLNDHWWPNAAENEPKRACDFLDFLLRRPERKIVVVSHGAFLWWIHESLPPGHPAKLGRHMRNVETWSVSRDDLSTLGGQLATYASSDEWSWLADDAGTVRTHDWWLPLETTRL